jgi:hypothetical protein
MLKPSKTKNTINIKKTLKIFNFIHSCLHLPKDYYNSLYRKKNKKTLIILNRKS